MITKIFSSLLFGTFLFWGVLQAETFNLDSSYVYPVSGNLLTNGSFETRDFSGWTLGGDFIFNGITINPSLVNNGTAAAAFGAVGNTASISQTFNTVIGDTYQVGFAVNFGFAGGAPSSFSANIAGIDPLILVNPAATNGYVTYTGMFTATDVTNTITFAFRDDPGQIFFDSASVVDVSVPEPSTYLLLGSLIALAALFKSKQLKVAKIPLK